MQNHEAIKIARDMLGHFNEPKAERDIPLKYQAMTLVTLPSGGIVKLSGFAQPRQTLQVARKHLRDIAEITVAHVIVERGSHVVVETRAKFIDCGMSRRSAEARP
jgi:hypothetical protein